MAEREQCEYAAIAGGCPAFCRCSGCPEDRLRVSGYSSGATNLPCYSCGKPAHLLGHWSDGALRCLDCGHALNTGTCDWGDCDGPTVGWRNEPNVGRLSVCALHAVYRCPSCGRFFDSPSVCSDGTQTVLHDPIEVA